MCYLIIANNNNQIQGDSMMDEMINNFVNSLIADGKSIRTVDAYKADLSAFTGYVTNYIGKPVNALKYSDMRLWVNDLEKYGFSASTRARKIASIKSFFKWLMKMEYISRNPAEGLESPKLPKKQPKVISVEDSKSMLYDAKNANNDHITCFRDYTIISMFLTTGIRREELSNVKISDIDMDSGTILIHGKGNKERIAYINDTLRPILSEYMAVYRGKFKTSESSQYLFVSTRTSHISLNGINKVVNNAMERSGIKESGVSAHILRKRFATTVFNNTGDIATISKLLGHSSPSTTMRYVSIGEDTMRNATNAVNF